MSDAVVSNQDETVKMINDALGGLVKLMERKRADNDYPWIVFSLDDTEYAINTRYVLRVAVLYAIVPYADAPGYCPGVIWDRNGILRLLDLRALLGRGDYMSAVAKENGEFPMIIVIEPDGKRCGMIVDKIVVLEHVNVLIEASANEGYVQSRYVKGSIEYDSQKDPALIIDPESFGALEFERQDTKIDWKGKVDMEMKEDAP